MPVNYLYFFIKLNSTANDKNMHAETKRNLYFFLYNASTYKRQPHKPSSAEIKHIATLSLKI